ncbi:hypothetical protein HYZ78_01460 [Candidatus Microgenomates bacterium]|nr:hypothetical protein [Candidatus Microgenomates bacterium]
MPYTFTQPVRYSLVKSSEKAGNLESDFQRINDYLLTFVGEITVLKEDSGSLEISYTEVPFRAILKTNTPLPVIDDIVSSQITLTCEKEDNLSVNLIRNVTGNIGYRIFNLQTQAYLANDPNLMDLTTFPVYPNVRYLFQKLSLSPLFQYRNSMVFFAKDKKGQIHLVNRHLIEYLTAQDSTDFLPEDFSTVVAKDISRFIALFDRGLIPISFYEYSHNPITVVNQSGFNPNSLEKEVVLEVVFFMLEPHAQNFTQLAPNRLDKVKKGSKVTPYIRYALKDSGISGKILAIKMARDISYKADSKGKLIPKLTISVFLE